MYMQTLIIDQIGPRRIVGWKDAVTDMFNGKLIVLKDYPEILAVLGREAMKQFPKLRESLRQVLGADAESVTVRVPAVAMLRRYDAPRKRGARFSRVGVCVRDNFTCQYCGDPHPMRKLELEHVLPRSRGGRTAWDNVVMACTGCNSYKRDRTPEEAGMTLINGRGHVRKPDGLFATGPVLDQSVTPKEWTDFLN